MTIAILSNVNLKSIAVKTVALTKEEIYYPRGDDTWLQEISAPDSGLYSSEAGMAFLILHGRTFPGELSDWKTARSNIDRIARYISDASESHAEMTFVVSSLDIPDTVIRPLCSPSVSADIAAHWREAIENIPLPMLNLSEMAANIGRRAFYNSRIWYMNGMPFSKVGEDAIAAGIKVIWKAYSAPRKKCLALDLDNTLWGGSIGELGLEGVHLAKSGSGARFHDFQKKILELRRSGVLLAIISKNNMVDAINGIDGHPGMALRSDDFAAIIANRKPKSQNLISLAESLGIGTDSIVFLDDNPVERDMMRAELPDAAVPDFPADSSRLEDFIIQVARDYFSYVKTPDNPAEAKKP